MTLDEMLAREAIRHIISVYANAVDRGGFDEVTATFAKDGIYEPMPGQVLTDHVQIKQFLSGLARDFGNYAKTSGLTLWLRHQITSSRIEFETADRAKGWTSFLAMGPSGLDHAGTYSDRFVHRDERWLFAQRKITIYWYAPTSAIPTALASMAT